MIKKHIIMNKETDILSKRNKWEERDDKIDSKTVETIMAG